VAGIPIQLVRNYAETPLECKPKYTGVRDIYVIRVSLVGAEFFVPSMAGTVLRNNFEIRNRNKLA
jgi:hypothetical protein